MWLGLLLAGSRWTFVDDDLVAVTIGPAGRPWLERKVEPPHCPDDDALRRSVERAVAGGTAVVDGRVVLLERGGAVWVRHSLRCGGLSRMFRYASGEWSTWSPTAGGAPVDTLEYERWWLGKGYEDPRGNRFFVAGSGVWRLDPAGRWSVEPPDLEPHQSCRGQFDTGPDGSVYAWGQTCGIRGIWRHDGTRWERFPFEPDLWGLVPRPGGAIVHGAPDDLYVWSPAGLAPPPQEWPGTSQGRIAALGGGAAVLFSPAPPRSWLVFVPPEGPWRPVEIPWDWRLAPLEIHGVGSQVLLGRAGRGVVAWDGEGLVPVTPPDLRGIWQFHGIDADGGWWFGDPERLVVHHPEAPERSDVATRILESGGWVVRSGDGTVWTWLAGPELTGVARWRDGGWDRPAGAPDAEPRSVFPLRGEAVLLVGRDDAATLYDGAAWDPYPSLEALVEARHRDLVDLYDPALAPVDFYDRLVVDRRGRAWVAGWTTFRRWDGEAWLDLVPWLAEQGVDWTPRDQVGVLSSVGRRVYVERRRRDPAPRAFVARGRRLGSVDPRPPVALVDAAGRSWTVDDDEVRVGGARGHVEGADGDSRLASCADGRVWLVHHQGLSQLVVAGGRVIERQRLERGSPKEWTWRAAVCDREGALWVVGEVDPYRRAPLTRIALPEE